MYSFTSAFCRIAMSLRMTRQNSSREETAWRHFTKHYSTLASSEQVDDW